MNSGDLLVKLGFVLAIASAVLYAPALRDRGRNAGRGIGGPGAWLFAAHAAALTAALVLLARHFLAHDFSFSYVAQYSSRSLSPSLTLAALWAGQEGSILLWTALSALLGLFLMVQPGPLSRPAMFFAAVTQAFISVLLLVRSPFALNAVIPSDGQGLNPLLEDPWMVTHPPVLFVGYAAMLVPFALTAAALVRHQYRDWSRQVWPWALFAVVSLGTGIVLGGIWAYKTLGWGGFWGWDPVENASLVPWLLAIALLHGLLIQRTVGAIVRTNMLLAVLGWVATIGGTYLTRSGILSDFSVHSFPDTGLNTPLVSWLALTTSFGAAMLGARWRTIEARTANWMNVSREAALWLGLMTVLVLAVLVAIGTTMPLITSLSGKPANVQPTFYHGVALPLGLAILLLMALAPALRWTRQQGLSWMALLPPGVAAGALALAFAIPAGLRDPVWIVLLFASGLGLGVNAWMALRLFRRGWMFGAGYLGHVGVALMAVGIATSVSLGKSQRLVLPQGHKVEALGYTITFEGEEVDARGGRHLALRVTRGNYVFDAHAKLMESPRGDGMIRNPALDLRRDLYLSPLEVRHTDAAAGGGATWMTVGEPVQAGGASWTFEGFRMVNGPPMRAYADIAVQKDGKAMHVTPYIQDAGDHGDPFPAEAPGFGTVSLARLDTENKRVAVVLPGAVSEGALAVVEFSTKPLVNLVWIGALLALAGTALAGIRRAAEQRAEEARAPRVPAMDPQTV
jgi:cytochrome c-type biogenesis protein CcmF